MDTIKALKLGMPDYVTIETEEKRQVFVPAGQTARWMMYRWRSGMRRILCKASEQNRHKIPADWKDTDCPTVWTGKRRSAISGMRKREEP